MKGYVFRQIVIGIGSLVLLFGQAFGHGGGLDSNGGHHNRKTGEYHYHRGPAPASRPATVKPAAEANTAQSKQSAISPAIRDQRIGDYFRRANENVGALSCDMTIKGREVPEPVKEAVKRRDGHRCVICGSTTKLEVDHKRALMNGGANDESNLATLCDDCHTEKTRMDNSLRRKRENLCRK